MPLNLCGLQAAEANRALTRYLAEDPDCWGVAPASGASRELRIASSSLTASKNTTTSNEMRADRMVADIIETSASSGGDIDGEFSAGTTDDFMQAFLLGLWTKPMGFDRFSGANVSIVDGGTATEIHIAGGDYTAYFVAGRVVKTEGFSANVNNNYFTIASSSFAAGVTTVVTTVDTGVTEAGTAYSTVMDANDAIVRSTAIRAGTAGARAFDSNGGNAFASAIAAGHLVVGQKIYVSGLGYETATIQVASQPADADAFLIFDGEKTVRFEFDTSGTYTRGSVPVTIGATVNDTATNLRNAIVDQFNQNNTSITASVATDTVTVKNFYAAQGAAVTETLSSLTVSAFTGANATAHGFYTVTALTNDVITVAEPVGTDANAGTAQVVIKGSHLRNPGDPNDIIRQSFTIETEHTDVNQTFVRYGQRVGSFEIVANAGDMVTTKFSFEGKNTETRPSTLLGAAPYTALASTATPVLNATTNVGNIYKNGTLLATALQSITLTGEAALRMQMAVGSKFPAGIGTGRFNLTGKMTSYFETLEMYDHFLNHDTISVAFDFSDANKNAYWFTIPALVITSDPISPGGNDQDVMEELEFAAKRDPNLNTQFMVDRFSSTIPTTA